MSLWAFVIAVLVIAHVGGSFITPWWIYLILTLLHYLERTVFEA